tara:strand:- start:175 stop:387 length:213 start_codon:yes stop_codon:yes gene_type:complete
MKKHHINEKMETFTSKILKNPPPGKKRAIDKARATAKSYSDIKRKSTSERDKFNKEVENILKKKGEDIKK